MYYDVSPTFLYLVNPPIPFSFSYFIYISVGKGDLLPSLSQGASSERLCVQELRSIIRTSGRVTAAPAPLRSTSVPILTEGTASSEHGSALCPNIFYSQIYFKSASPAYPLAFARGLASNGKINFKDAPLCFSIPYLL